MWPKPLFLNEEPNWIFTVFSGEFTLGLVPSPDSLREVTLPTLVCSILPSLVLDSNRASGQRAQHPTLLSASVVVLEFVRSLQVPVKYWRARNVYLHGFKPREGYKLTESRVQSENQHLEFCAVPHEHGEWW